MQSIIVDHPYGALSVPASGPEERRARSRGDLARLAVLDPEQLPRALAFLSGYHPQAFSAALEAVEPSDGPSAEDAAQERTFLLEMRCPGGHLPSSREGVPALPRRPQYDQQAEAVQGGSRPGNRVALSGGSYSGLASLPVWCGLAGGSGRSSADVERDPHQRKSATKLACSRVSTASML